MRRWVVLFLAGTLISSVSAFSLSPDSTELRVMSFNIRYDNPHDGIFSWDQRKELVFNVLQLESPDIIGFQEALVNQTKELADNLSSLAWYGVGRDDGNQKGEYAPIFYRKDCFALLDSGFFWLSETPEVPGSISWGAACTRIVTWVQLSENSSKQILFIFNTHFDHVSEDARVHASELLLSKIRTITGDADLILTGDFNCTPEDHAFQLLNTDLTATGPSVKDLDDACSFVGFPAKNSPGNIIDFIFFKGKPGISPGKYEIVDFHQGELYPSDHLPVVSDFYLW